MNLALTPCSARLNLVLVLALAGGCGEKSPKPVPVEGTVSLDGGTWPKSGHLTFFPDQPKEGFPRALGVAEFNSAGKFVAQSRRPGDGLMPGRYKVGVQCWEIPPDGTHDGRNSYVPDKMRNPQTSGLAIEVPLEGVRDLTLDISRR